MTLTTDRFPRTFRKCPLKYDSDPKQYDRNRTNKKKSKKKGRK